MSSISSLNSLLSSLTSGSAASSPSSSINLSSLLQAATGSGSSGIDVSSAVSAALYADRAPERQWQAEQSTISSQFSALSSIQSALASVSTDLQRLGTTTGVLASRTVSSSVSQVSATASGGAATGTHSVAVQSLATTASWYSPALPGSTSSLGDSTFTITGSDGSQNSFTTGWGVNSVSDLASAINGASIGITASVVTDATGSRLALVSSATGASADFTVSCGASGVSTWSSATVANASSPLASGSFQLSDGSSSSTIATNAGDTLSDVADSINASGLALNAAVITDPSGAHLEITPTAGGSVSISSDPTLTMTRASTAQNASLTVDGIPISSPSNSVTGAIPDVTLSLSGTTPAGQSAALAVAADTSSISQALSTFVSDYNAALSQVNSQFTFNASTSSEGVLGTDSTIRSLQATLEGLAGYTSSAGAGSNSITSLAGLGISMNNDGSLSLDTSTLNQALANPQAVQNFLQGTALNGFAQQATSALAAYGDPATGSIASEIKNLKQQYSALQSQVSDYESTYIASQQTVLTAMYSKAEIALEQLPTEMQQIQQQLGNNSSKG